MPAQGKKSGPGTLIQAQHQAAERAADQDRTLAASTSSKPPPGQV